MDTLESTVAAPCAMHDMLVAELSELGYVSFQSSDEVLQAFISAPSDSARLREMVEAVVERYGIRSAPDHRIIAARDWNREWEATIEPISVGPFVIAPSWSDAVDESRIVIRIDPKLSFGTGHHASTRLALICLSEHLRPGDVVLDAGTGTGILSIAAVKLGALRVHAFDVDSWVADNFRENVGRNLVEDKIVLTIGDVEDIRSGPFDLIVANINRHILLRHLCTYRDLLRVGGRVIMSGVLVTDRAVMLGAASASGMVFEAERSEGEWWACCLLKAGSD